jgi:hypothetical protein
MKYMKSLSCATGALLFGGTLGLAPAALAGVEINGHFYNDNSGSGYYYFSGGAGASTTQVGGGVFATAGGYWNAFNSPSLPATSLLNASGQATGVTFAQSMAPTHAGTHSTGPGWINGFGGGPNEALMNSYAYSKTTSANPNTFIFAGLAAGATFDLYIYTQPDGDGAGRRLGMTVEGVTQTSSAASITESEFVLGQNYLKFSGITVGASGTIGGSWWMVAGEADFNGFQLIETTVVPAPGAAALLLAAGLFGSRRRR